MWSITLQKIHSFPCLHHFHPAKKKRRKSINQQMTLSFGSHWKTHVECHKNMQKFELNIYASLTTRQDLSGAYSGARVLHQKRTCLYTFTHLLQTVHINALLSITSSSSGLYSSSDDESGSSNSVKWISCKQII